ncbi:hypothetical protein ABZ401_17965 [Streptomyces sp. NPDC005892]|uniref:hypothetical protein n=1 Tax=Streptomyces sp. NPDC005892 TaxID=3155593 RepID=UPI00340B73A3
MLVGILIQVVFDAPRELLALVIAMLVGLVAGERAGSYNSMSARCAITPPAQARFVSPS